MTDSEGGSSEGKESVLSWDSPALQGWSGLMRSGVWLWSCTAWDVSVLCTHIYNHERECTIYIHNFTFINMYVHTTYIYIYSCTCTYTFMLYLYVHGINMSVLCSDTYVPFCPILFRWVGFQMILVTIRSELQNLKSHFAQACIKLFKQLYRLCERRFVRTIDLQKGFSLSEAVNWTLPLLKSTSSSASFCVDER